MIRRSALVLVVAGLVLLAGCTGGLDDPAEPTTESGTTADVGAAESTTTATTDSAQTDATTTAEAEQTTARPDGPPPNGTVAVHFINVGQGASALVVGPTGDTMLVDTGPWQDDGRDVLAYLERANVTRLDALVTSHADADHIGGHEAVIDHFETQGGGVAAVYDPGIAATSKTYDEYLAAVERHDVPLYRTQTGDAVPIEGVNVTVLAPPPGGLGDDRNENSIVLRVTFGETVFLLSGDAAFREEDYLVDTYGGSLRATVLQAGHHGSRSSSSPAFLDAVQPRLVVISSAYDSVYGHPHEEVLARLSARDVPAVWTGTLGNVVVRSDGRYLTVLAQRDAPTDPDALRDGDAVEPGLIEPVHVLTSLGSGGTGSTTTTAVPDGGPALGLVTVHADAAGADAENLNDEYVVFENAGDEPLDLSGWTVRDEADHVYTFPDGTVLAAGGTLTLYTGTGTDADANRYWGSARPIWNNDGDTVIVRDVDGETVLEASYYGS